tara:strand:- start:210 stop:398 length:189 start_codon:yes stop_codon:yes gene_type:complete
MVHFKKSPTNLASLGGSVIAAVITSVVFIGDSNVGDCPRSKSAEATSTEAHQKADQKTYVEA